MAFLVNCFTTCLSSRSACTFRTVNISGYLLTAVAIKTISFSLRPAGIELVFTIKEEEAAYIYMYIEPFLTVCVQVLHDITRAGFRLHSELAWFEYSFSRCHCASNFYHHARIRYFLAQPVITDARDLR